MMCAAPAFKSYVHIYALDSIFFKDTENISIKGVMGGFNYLSRERRVYTNILRF